MGVYVRAYGTLNKFPLPLLYMLKTKDFLLHDKCIFSAPRIHNHWACFIAKNTNDDMRESWKNKLKMHISQTKRFNTEIGGHSQMISSKDHPTEGIIDIIYRNYMMQRPM